MTELCMHTNLKMALFML